ncbi:double-stranded RNA-specific adenosine deaminase-like isoform X2 [Babylonia areolata]|uniref:double-stranded RNA-specific adenosine deaminase-like isoform X2 n=1 Tax=Babylonia areolata TaxID=304850 RepID=UPI003FD3697A
MEKVSSAPPPPGPHGPVQQGYPTKRYKTRIISYTVVSKASKPIIRRRRVAEHPPDSSGYPPANHHHHHHQHPKDNHRHLSHHNQQQHHPNQQHHPPRLTPHRHHHQPEPSHHPHDAPGRWKQLCRRSVPQEEEEDGEEQEEEEEEEEEEAENSGVVLPSSQRTVGSQRSSNNSDGDDSEELEGLVGLPDRVLMFNKRDPVSILMEYGQTREVKVSFTEMSRSGPHHASRFHTAAIVDGETHVQATGTSKKNAKKAAAILALRTMYERGMAHLQQGNDTVNGEVRDMEREEGTSSVCHGTRVMHVSRRMLEVAEETQFINYSKDKVLATMVLERRGTYTVVGLGTGNRCIQYQNLPTDGSRVIHSHAEIIARRAFIRYMLKQLSSYRGSERHALFSRCRHTGLLRLHDDIRVHLYISRPPCGDAAAFPTITNFPNRMRAIRKQGQLRTIIDDGEGAIPTEFQLPANANGKERLRVMTCSDKILRWNAVGIQGALLSNFLNPIYLSSVVIGSHTGDQRGHVPRAVSGRLKCGRLHEVLMKPFRISSPEIVYPPHSDNYAITKSKQYCITWCEGDPDAEVIDAVSGAVAMEPNNDSPSSRVSKRTLLSLFRQASHTLRADHLASLTYTEAKVAARAYQRTKKSVEAHLQNCGFGQWLSLQQTYGVDNFREAEKLQQQQE